MQHAITSHQFDAARTDIEAQLKRAPNDDRALNCMGQLLLEEGKAGEAAEWFDRAIKVDGKNAVHHVWLGRAIGTYSETANPIKRPFLARRYKGAYEQAVALDPKLVDARRGLVMFYANAPGPMGGGMEKARQQAAAILKLNAMRGHMAYGYIAERENDFATAVTEYETAIILAPDSAMYPRLSLARVLILKLQEYDRGAKEAQLWLASPPADAAAANVANAHYYLGVAHQQRGRADQARAAYQAAVAANPKNEDARKALASLK